MEVQRSEKLRNYLQLFFFLLIKIQIMWGSKLFFLICIQMMIWKRNKIFYCSILDWDETWIWIYLSLVPYYFMGKFQMNFNEITFLMKIHDTFYENIIFVVPTVWFIVLPKINISKTFYFELENYQATEIRLFLLYIVGSPKWISLKTLNTQGNIFWCQN